MAGAVSFGEIMQAAAAFVAVQAAFNWLVDNYQRVADWLSSVNRVAALLVSLDRLAPPPKRGQTGKLAVVEGDRLAGICENGY